MLRNLKFWRQNRNLSQQNLAAIIGRSQAWISDVERGATPTNPGDVQRIAEALGVPERALIEPLSISTSAGVELL